MPERILCSRFAHVARVFFRHAIRHLLLLLYYRSDRFRRTPWVRRRLEPLDRSGPDRLRALFEDLGGTFLKLGQMLALQPDILSLEYCSALFNLLDRVPPFPYQDAERVFREETGQPPGDVFDSIDQTPLATASIGQVHVAWRDGRKYAVKIQRPAAERDFEGDIRLIRFMTSIIRRFHIKPLQWMLEPLSEFVAWTAEELDYRSEARYMLQLRANSEDNPHEYVPKVLMDFTTRRTLVVEFLEGETLLSYLRARDENTEEVLARLAQGGFDPEKVAARIVNNFLGDAFRHGLFHADLHPANLMILPRNVVGYVDFGITGCISSFSRQKLVSLTLAYTRGDLDSMCQAFFQVSAMDHRSSPSGFREGLRRYAASWYAGTGSTRKLRKNFTLVMLDMLTLSRLTNIWPERDVIKYIRSAIAIDGLITRFAPDFNLGRHLAQACARYLKWHAWMSRLTQQEMFEWLSSGASMTWNGSVRAATLARQLARGEVPLRIQIEPSQSRSRSASAALFLSLFMTAQVAAVWWGVEIGTLLPLLAVSTLLWIDSVRRGMKEVVLR